MIFTPLPESRKVGEACEVQKRGKTVEFPTQLQGQILAGSIMIYQIMGGIAKMTEEFKNIF